MKEMLNTDRVGSLATGASWMESVIRTILPYSPAKPKDSNCLLEKKAVTIFWFCTCIEIGSEKNITKNL